MILIQSFFQVSSPSLHKERTTLAICHCLLLKASLKFRFSSLPSKRKLFYISSMLLLTNYWILWTCWVILKMLHSFLSSARHFRQSLYRFKWHEQLTLLLQDFKANSSCVRVNLNLGLYFVSRRIKSACPSSFSSILLALWLKDKKLIGYEGKL